MLEARAAVVRVGPRVLEHLWVIPCFIRFVSLEARVILLSGVLQVVLEPAVGRVPLRAGIAERGRILINIPVHLVR